MLETKENKEMKVEEFFAIITDILREELIATYTKEEDAKLRIRFVGGQTFQLKIEKI